MKRLLLFMLILPQLAYSQFLSKSFIMEPSNKVVKARCGMTISRDTTIMLDSRSKISGLSITGTSILNNDNNSFIRVTLEDDYHYEYLVYEIYPMLVSDLKSGFENIAMETVMLDNVTPKKMNIQLLNASITIDDINYLESSNSEKLDIGKLAAIQKSQVQDFVDLLNANLERRYALWRADVTSFSKMSYEEKKAMYGGNLPELYGWEHYRSGFFLFPSDEDPEPSRTTRASRTRDTNSYITEWDWRDRHDKNWMTSAKDQDTCNTCWAFNTIGVVEAYKNLYYNQILQNNDLSEQELVSCVSGSDCSGGRTEDALDYIRDYGVVNESWYPYSATNGDCDDINQNPDERVFLQGYKDIKRYMGDSITVSIDSIKKSLFRCPLTVSYKNHAMVLTGYKVIEVNDTLPEWYWGWPIPVNNTINQHLIGQTAWLIKNTNGSDWGDHGFGYILGNSNKLYRIFMPTGRITSLQYNDSDIVCEDADGDGYYFWGVGDKPAHCPSWAPDTPDGDDSDINSGPLDNYGYCANLPPGITIKVPKTYSGSVTESRRIGIVNGGTLTITGSTTLTGNARIRVCENGILIIDGGSLNDAKIDMVPGGKLIIRNNGTINMAYGENFNAPAGAIVEIEEGEIVQY